MEQHKVYVLFGASGSGKSTIAQELSKFGVPEHRSHTTRPIRKGEVHGVNYYFVSMDEFNSTEMIECAEYNGNWYGLSEASFEDTYKTYPVSVVVMEVRGLEMLRQAYPECVESIYIKSNVKTCINRMMDRGDGIKQVADRLVHAQVHNEFNNESYADHIVDNTGSLEDTMNQVFKIMGLGQYQKAS